MTSYSDNQVAQLPKGTSDSIALYPRRWAAAIVMVIAALMDLIDGTIVNVALPTLQRDLHASGTQVEWTVSCLLYTSPSPRDRQKSRMPSSA